jgi:hypothetical protein
MTRNFESLFFASPDILSGLASDSPHRPRGGTHQSDRRACMALATAKAGRITSALLISLFAYAAQAQDAAPPTAANVEVVGVRDPLWKPYRDFLRGMKEYDKRKQELAPASQLSFEVIPNQAAAGMEGIALKLAAADLDIAVPVDPKGFFTLPVSKAAEEANAELELNRKKSLYTWRPRVRSFDDSPSVRRLGDLRLECHVRWAVEKNDVPFLRRALLDTLGICESGRVAVIYRPRKAVAAIELIDGERRAWLAQDNFLPDGLGFRLPIHDSKWSHDTEVRISYRD